MKIILFETYLLEKLKIIVSPHNNNYYVEEKNGFTFLKL